MTRINYGADKPDMPNIEDTYGTIEVPDDLDSSQIKSYIEREIGYVVYMWDYADVCTPEVCFCSPVDADGCAYKNS